MSKTYLFTFTLAAAAITGCAAGPVESGSIAITVNSMNESDVGDDGAVWKDENISTGTSNPWGDFVKAAEEECGGSPASFEFTSVTVNIALDDGATADEILGGQAEVRVISTQGSDEDADKATIGSIALLNGVGPYNFEVAPTQDYSSFHDRLVGGDFHIGFWAEVVDVNEGFDMDVTINFEALANCE